MTDSVDGKHFGLSFTGLSKARRDAGAAIHHIVEPPAHWSLYHTLLPIWTGFTDAPFTDLFRRQLCPDSAMNASLCPRQSLVGTKYAIEHVEKLPLGNFKHFSWRAGPRGVSRLFEEGDGLSMAHMSLSGVGSAHSVAKAASHFLFSGKVLRTATVRSMLSEAEARMDLLMGFESTFTRGGFNRWTIQGIEWFGWGGWGGSAMLFAPEYECVIAWTVTAFNSPHYPLLSKPRTTAILNLVSMQLLSDQTE